MVSVLLYVPVAMRVLKQGYWLSMKQDRVIQICNVVDDTNIGFKNPQRGRVYSIDGISPTIYCFEGGNLEPKVLLKHESD
jgi:hypothetical protein